MPGPDDYSKEECEDGISRVYDGPNPPITRGSMDRISRDDLYMGLAFLTAKRGTCKRLKVGAVVVSEKNRVLSTGYCGAPPGELHCLEVGCRITAPGGGCTRTLHAEHNAMTHAVGLSPGSTIYCTHSPCEPCAKMILHGRIARLVYALPYRMNHPLEYLRDGGIKVEVYDTEFLPQVGY